MSTTRNILRTCNSVLDSFIQDFGFYLDSLDHIFHLQGQIGLDRPALSALPEHEQNRFKSYLFLTESVNTTSMGALRLFAGNLYSDAFALLRMIYEATCLMHYGNQSTQHGDKLYKTMFKSCLDDPNHIKGEWALIKKAQSHWENEEPDLIPLRQYINNFGAHISRAKIVLGNVCALGNQSASTIFMDSSRKREYLMGLDLLHCLLMKVLEEYNKQAVSYPRALPTISNDIAAHNEHFLAKVRPRLRKIGKLANN